MNENNCDLLPFVTQSYFASLIQNSIKIHRRSLCNIADLSNSEESFHSLTHLYHLDTFELIFFFLIIAMVISLPWIYVNILNVYSSKCWVTRVALELLLSLTVC